MARIPDFQRFDNGDASVRVRLARPIVLVIDEFAREAGIDPKGAFQIMLMHIKGMFEQGHAEFFGPNFESALKRVRTEHFGAISAGETIDTTKLHRSSKTKSGYVGVYASGKGFRAEARISGAMKYLGSFETAEEAAWKRFCYYRDNRLPYGELEVEMQAWRANGFQGSDDDLIEQIMVTAKDSGTTHIFEELVAMRQGRTSSKHATVDDHAQFEEGEGLAGLSPATAAALLRK